jgi:hypothetical protein
LIVLGGSGYVKAQVHGLFAGFGGSSRYNLGVNCAYRVEIGRYRTISMQSKLLFVLFFLPALAAGTVLGADSPPAASMAAQDLHLEGPEVLSYKLDTGEQLLLFEAGFSMSVGTARFSGDKAVLWLTVKPGEIAYGRRVSYAIEAYIEGRVSAKQDKDSRSMGLVWTTVEKGKSIAVRFEISGKVFVTTENRTVGDPGPSALYRKAVAAVRPAEPEPEAKTVEPPVDSLLEEPPEKPVREPPRRPVVSFRYPVNIAPAGEAPLDISVTTEEDGTYVATVIGRFFLWQKQKKGDLLELQADNAVIWYAQDANNGSEEPPQDKAGEKSSDFLAGGSVKAVYMSGDVLMTQGPRTVRADKLYYNFDLQRALAIDAEMRTFDSTRGIPIYVRAAKLRQVAENKFAAEDITLTTSEFHRPQISASAESVLIEDTTVVDERQGRLSDKSYDAQLRAVRMKYEDTTILYWPFLRSNLERPDIPLKSLHAGYDSDLGTITETRWYLCRLLGLREPEGTESTYALDYYSERGLGTGVEISYAKGLYFGSLLGYVIHDSGEDDLGRISTRRNLKPPRKLRGRFSWRHRHFLPYNWQLTSEISYLSDENFLEGFYRNEFYAGKDQETLLHLKRIEDNWGLSLLGKVRINDYANTTEELPSFEYHLTGQSLFDDMFTLYSDSQASRFRYRQGEPDPSTSHDFFTFLSERAELDMPLRLGQAKLVPFVAGTVGYEDGSGFYTDLGGARAESERDIWIGEVGGRLSTQYWKIHPQVKSRLWDLNGLRHIVRPHLTAVGFAQSDLVAEQRDTLNVGISQRLQTKRGPGKAGDNGWSAITPQDANQRTVDWMRLDLDVTWVNNSGDASAGPDRFIWSEPFMPLVDNFSRAIPPRDRRSSDLFGPRRNYISGDYEWRLSDTTAILSDLNYDMQSGVVQQLNVGVSRMRWPDLSYYVGSRYLRRINTLGEKGSNVFTFAATYVLDPRYTLVFSQQYDFDYKANIRSDITLIRRYHRIYCGFTYSADESLKRQAIVFSIWPQGVPELALGPRRYMRVADSPAY